LWGAAGVGSLRWHARLGIAQNTITRGIGELRLIETLAAGGARRPGRGGRRLVAKDATLPEDLERLAGGETRDDPELPLHSTSKSVRRPEAGLCELGHPVSYYAVARLLCFLGFNLQANAKAREASRAPTATRGPGTSTSRSRRRSTRVAGNLGRHEGEGTGRRLQERRA